MSDLLFICLLAQSVKSEEHKSYRDKSNEKDQDPHCHSANTLCVKVQEEVGVYQGGIGGGDHNRRIELENCSLNENEDNVYKREAHGSQRVIPFCLFSFIKQKPIGYVHNGKYNVEAKAAYAPVELRVAAFRARKHYIEYKEGEQYAEHADKF